MNKRRLARLRGTDPTLIALDSSSAWRGRLFETQDLRSRRRKRMILSWLATVSIVSFGLISIQSIQRQSNSVEGPITSATATSRPGLVMDRMVVGPVPQIASETGPSNPAPVRDPGLNVAAALPESVPPAVPSADTMQAKTRPAQKRTTPTQSKASHRAQVASRQTRQLHSPVADQAVPNANSHGLVAAYTVPAAQTAAATPDMTDIPSGNSGKCSGLKGLAADRCERCSGLGLFSRGSCEAKVKQNFCASRSSHPDCATNPYETL